MPRPSVLAGVLILALTALAAAPSRAVDAKTLHALYRRVQSGRAKARGAKKEMKALDKEGRSLTDELTLLRGHFRAVSARLAELDANVNPREYNQALAEMERTSVEIRARQSRLEEIERLQDAVTSEGRRYADSFQELQALLKDEEGRDLSPDEEEDRARMRSRLRELSDDFRVDPLSGKLVLKDPK